MKVIIDEEFHLHHNESSQFLIITLCYLTLSSAEYTQIIHALLIDTKFG